MDIVWGGLVWFDRPGAEREFVCRGQRSGGREGGGW